MKREHVRVASPRREHHARAFRDEPRQCRYVVRADHAVRPYQRVIDVDGGDHETRPRGAHALCHASNCSRSVAISASVPTVIRRNDAVSGWLGKYRTSTLLAYRCSYAARATAGPVSPRWVFGSVNTKFDCES